MKKEENYNNKASAKKWDKLIKESDDEYLIENIKKQKNKNVVFGSASLFTSFNISNNNTINKINNISNNNTINKINNIRNNSNNSTHRFSILDKGERCNHYSLANFHNQGYRSQRRPGYPAIVSALSSYRHIFKGIYL